jgi:hypothetical protein
MTEPDISVRAFDQPRDIAHRKAVEVWILNDANLRMKCREWVPRDLRSRFEIAESSVDFPAFG